MNISEEAYNHIKKLAKTKELYRDIDSICCSVDDPSIFFMAGSPGAGKTEFSKNFILDFKKRTNDFSIARIDADDLRELCPQYCGSNSSDVQKAAVLGVNKLYDHCLKKKYNILLDGTFANFDYAKINIERALKIGEVQIFYIYQDPETAWEFTLKREKIEGRSVDLNIFIDAFFNSWENVIKIKKIFKQKVKIDILMRDKFNKELDKLFVNVEDVDKYIKLKYDKKTLFEVLKSVKF